MTDGLLVVDKQKGWTSYDVVAFLRRTLGTNRVGHAGTLDPLASGILLIASGRAARMLDFLTADKKVYETTIHLGQISSTHDAEGEIEHVSDKVPSLEDITAVLPQFVGRITQIPPVYSAIRVGGIRAYDLARSGQVVEMPSREVDIDLLELISYDYPYLTLRVECSKGTYIRTLGSDIGQALGVGGYLSALRRTRSGSFDIASAFVLSNTSTKDEIISAMIPLRKIPLSFPTLVLSSGDAEEIFHGRKLANTYNYVEGERISLMSEDQELLAVAQIKGNQICVYKNFT